MESRAAGEANLCALVQRGTNYAEFIISPQLREPSRTGRVESSMNITLGPTDQIEPIAEGIGQIWVGRTAGGIEIVAVIAVVECKPEDHQAFMLESALAGSSFSFVQAAAVLVPARAAPDSVIGELLSPDRP